MLFRQKVCDIKHDNSSVRLSIFNQSNNSFIDRPLRLDKIEERPEMIIDEINYTKLKK